ncbi:MAG: hypothetical protein H5U08_00310 [Thermogutta sp.]|uniref:hypothetical protein n=1 Tax=Thermogutta sp. TaxID=1962930 RepID=UPI0019985DBB|nr:hypothetical protein [Thermogutta sp.]MBC7350777.1 hypothetical protein [Thermogutta sp.]
MNQAFGTGQAVHSIGDAQNFEEIDRPAVFFERDAFHGIQDRPQYNSVTDRQLTDRFSLVGIFSQPVRMRSPIPDYPTTGNVEMNRRIALKHLSPLISILTAVIGASAGLAENHPHPRLNVDLAHHWSAVLLAEQAIPNTGTGSGVQQSRPSAAQLRPELDNRLKTALRRNFQQTDRIISLQSLLERYSRREDLTRAVKTYWTVVRLVASVDMLSQSLSELETFPCPPERRPYLEGLKGGITGQLIDLRGQLAAAQFELAAWAGVTDAQGRVFPDDIPHTGGYNTYIDSLFHGQAPLEVRKIDELLPLVRQSIYLHFVAARSARDAWLAYRDAANAGAPNVEAAMQMWHLAITENLRCLEAVERYNELILEYILELRRYGQAPSNILPMLLEEGSRRVVSGAAAGSTPASRNTGDAATSARQADLSAERLPFACKNLGPFTPLDRPQTLICRLIAFRESATVETPELTKGFFSSITATRLEDFVKELARFCTAESMQIRADKTLTLSEYLSNSSGQTEDRRVRTIQYWEVVEAQDRLFVLIKQSAVLSELFRVALREAERPGGAELVLQIHAERNAADAALQDAHADLLEKQFILKKNIPTSDIDLTAVTPPFAGAYDTRWSELAPYITPAQRVHLGKIAYRLPGIYAAMAQTASALLSADLARQRDAEAYLRGQIPLNTVLASVQLEFDLWLQFIEGVGQYNRAIAQYAASCLPLASLNDYLKAIGVQ